MGKAAKLRGAVKCWRRAELAPLPHTFVDSLRQRTYDRAVARSAGMKMTYVEESTAKKRDPRITRAYHRALKKWGLKGTDFDMLSSVFSGTRASRGVTRRCAYE